ncbi:MAG: tRNA (guanosine(46)-N7)-methyltransferase TrmB [Woeseiaceae bacterium]|nr:tRNA (guanosine(46)-N7)-methyltransferase TrmB [Woeseiaceae bacterium]
MNGADDKPRKRTIRSFVRRSGRLTESQQRALDELWPRFGLEYSPETMDFESVFGRDAPVTLEIGFGNGDSLVRMAAANPERNYLGIEVHEPGIGHCLIGIREAGIGNLRLINHDAIEVLEQQIPPGSLDRINLYFPDPWPKKRHHKRRIVQPRFLDLCAKALIPGGTLQIATDWDNYAEHIDGTLDEAASFALGERRVHDGDQPLDRPQTKFERRGLTRGHRIHDWCFVRN